MEGMKMMDLGKKQKELYDSPTSPESQKNKIVYPEIDMPLEMCKGMGMMVGDEVEMHIKGKISGMQDTKWTQRVTIEAHQGMMEKSGKKKKSMLDEA